jgi:hypothetical protein
MAIVTRGMIYPPSEITVISSEKPTIHSVVEVKPQIRATVPPPTVGPAGTPMVISAARVAPEIRSTRGPQHSTGSETPLVEATELVPVIRKAEEEE